LERSASLPGWFLEGCAVKTLRDVKDLRLFRTNRIKNPARYLSGRESISSVPTGRRVLTVLLSTLVMIGLALLAFRHFEHF
jgi:hypothetical protein